MQSISLGALSGLGIVPTLVISGIVLNITGIAPGLGSLAIFSGIIAGIAYAVMGFVGIASRY